MFTKGIRGRLVRLPEAAGDDSGLTEGSEPALRLAVIGDSVAAGVGAADHREAMAGQLAAALSAMTGRAVWMGVPPGRAKPRLGGGWRRRRGPRCRRSDRACCRA